MTSKRHVIREVARIESEAKEATARATLAGEGVPVIDDWSPYGGRRQSAAALGDEPGELPVDPLTHRPEPCHAAHVGRRGEVTLLCTDPARHAPGGDSPASVEVGHGRDALDRRAEREQQRRAAKANGAVTRQRLGFLSELVPRRLPKSDVAALVLDQFIASARRDPARMACQLLGLTPVTGHYGEDWCVTLSTHAAGGPGERERAALALALAMGEESARHLQPGAHPPPVAERHLAFLSTFGYEPTEAEPPASG